MGGLLATGGEQRKEGEDRLRLRQADAGRLTDEADAPAQNGPLVLLRRPVADEENEFERFDEPDVRQVAGGGERLGQVGVIERAAQTRIRRALRCHEHMFAYRSETSVCPSRQT